MLDCLSRLHAGEPALRQLALDPRALPGDALCAPALETFVGHPPQQPMCDRADLACGFANPVEFDRLALTDDRRFQWNRDAWRRGRKLPGERQSLEGHARHAASQLRSCAWLRRFARLERRPKRAEQRPASRLLPAQPAVAILLDTE